MNFWELRKSLPNSDNQETVNEFLLDLKLMNKSKGTIIQYRDYLERFFIRHDESIRDLSSETLQQWFMKQEAHLMEKTLSQRIAILSSFFNFCVQEEYIELSPIKSRWYPRLPKPIPKFLEKEDIAKTRYQSEKLSSRNQAMVEFMLSSGCRIGEMHQLDCSDVNIENRSAHVLGKGGRIRQIHFSEKCRVLLERYLESREHEASALFTTSNGKRLGIPGIRKIVKELGEEAGMDTRLHPHRFRHTFATELLSKGADLEFIGAELGHTELSTTQIYARLPKRKIISLYRKYMG